jgi:hypothetical protein
LPFPVIPGLPALIFCSGGLILVIVYFDEAERFETTALE